MEREGRLRFGTVGRGNHFVELQVDERGRLWVSVHSGSRSMGPCVQRLYGLDEPGLVRLDERTPVARAFLRDHDWAVEYARRSREEIALRVCSVLRACFGFEPDLDSMNDCTHNLVRAENVAGRRLCSCSPC